MFSTARATSSPGHLVTGWCLNIIHITLLQPYFSSFFFQNWMTFATLHRPLFKEHGHVSFPNNVLPAKNHNFAFCEVRLIVKIMRDEMRREKVRERL